MKPSKSIQTMVEYANMSQYRAGPSPEQQAAGTIPLDTLPADWWNWLWGEITARINEAASDTQSVYQEILSVLADATVTPSAQQTDQLLVAIKAITRRYGTEGTAGAVKSSTDSGKVAIDASGYMSPNGMGIPSSLNTTAKTIVGAINEVLAAFNSYKTATDASITGLGNSKAPTNHASEETTYGVGTPTNYGHVKVQDSYDDPESAGEANTGNAASQKALALAYEALKGMIKSAAGGLPTHLDSSPLINATAGESGTFEVTEGTAGFYYIEAEGGKGGNGESRSTSGGVGGKGQLVKKVEFLLPGTYNYIVGTNGGTPTAGTGYTRCKGATGSVGQFSQSFMVTATGGAGGLSPLWSAQNGISNTLRRNYGEGGSGGNVANSVSGLDAYWSYGGSGGGSSGMNGGARSTYSSYQGSYGGGGGGASAFYSDTIGLVLFALGGGGGGGGAYHRRSASPSNGQSGVDFPDSTGVAHLKLWKLV